MKKLEPYYLLFIGVIICLLFSVSSNLRDTALDINIHDTYYVIGLEDFNLIIGIILLLLGSLYIVLEKWLFQLDRKLSWIHIGVTILISLFLLASNIYYIGIEGLPKRYYTNTSFPVDNNTLIVVLLLILGLIQIVFIINIARSFFRNKIKPSSEGD
ncbi:hypothetical protein ABN763_17810 [Spongiivirga sp. MCCC 1A20706]|uniref:hypothetical protein n=1 Tax=Spongiivirga sp. MCCC 1A20706 TaxID=3160963 RepID=UPI0039779509